MVGLPRVVGLSIPRFEARIRNVEAAQQSRHHKGAYESVAMGHFWTVLMASVVTGAFAGLFSTASARRAVGRLVERAGTPLWRRSPFRRLGGAFDRRLATRWPILWSARLPRALLNLLVVPTLVLIYATEWIGRPVTAWLAIPVLIFAVFLAFRAQESARHLGARGRQDVAVLAIHALVLISAAVLVVFAKGQAWEEIGPRATFGIMGMVMWCAALQGARIGSSLVAIGACLIAIGLAVGGIALRGGDRPTATWPAALFVALALLVYLVIHLEVRSMIQRMLIATLIDFSPMPVLFLAPTLAERANDVTPWMLAMLAIVGLAAPAVMLRLTERSRRSLAFH